MRRHTSLALLFRARAEAIANGHPPRQLAMGSIGFSKFGSPARPSGVDACAAAAAPPPPSGFGTDHLRRPAYRAARWLLPMSAMLLQASPLAASEWDPALKVADVSAVRADLERILVAAEQPLSEIRLGRVETADGSNEVTIVCTANGTVTLDIRSVPEEWAATFYAGLQKLGFLFPHPRVQVSPGREEILSRCGQTYVWDPRLKYRGFHLHNMHPNEWVQGFLMGDKGIAEDLVRWLARNGQNVLQTMILRTVALPELADYHRRPFELADALGIIRGVTVSFELQQQKSYRLIPQTTIRRREAALRSSIDRLVHAIDFDYLNVELGRTEFTPASNPGTLRYLNEAGERLRAHGRGLFIKIHASTGQYRHEWGNFNYIPQYAHPSVGVQPHTVMFYALQDESAPVYGRTNFADMRAFMVAQSRVRPTWYYPETSYWATMDSDVPLLLTDYLIARSQDMDLLAAEDINGQVNFTSGQELGYWLFDWTVALLVNREHAGDPMIGLRLLGECAPTWERILDYQHRHVKRKGILPMIAATAPTDELPKPFKHKTHSRMTLREVHKDRAALNEELSRLETAIAEMPPLDRVANPELRALLEITWLRVQHAHAVRQVLRYRTDRRGRAEWLATAASLRTAAQERIDAVIADHSRYPEVPLFEPWRNPTSYAFGLHWTARTLHFWKRDEQMVKTWNFEPDFMNIYSARAILF
jgi:hypothetical protein